MFFFFLFEQIASQDENRVLHAHLLLLTQDRCDLVLRILLDYRWVGIAAKKACLHRYTHKHEQMHKQLQMQLTAKFAKSAVNKLLWFMRV